MAAGGNAPISPALCLALASSILPISLAKSSLLISATCRGPGTLSSTTFCVAFPALATLPVFARSNLVASLITTCLRRLSNSALWSPVSPTVFAISSSKSPSRSRSSRGLFSTKASISLSVAAFNFSLMPCMPAALSSSSSIERRTNPATSSALKIVGFKTAVSRSLKWVEASARIFSLNSGSVSVLLSPVLSSAFSCLGSGILSSIPSNLFAIGGKYFAAGEPGGYLTVSLRYLRRPLV